MTWLLLTAAKLICPCITLRTSNSFARSGTGVVIDSDPPLSRTCKTSLLFAPLAVRVYTGCFDFPFYTPTKLLIRQHIRYKAVLFPKFLFFSFKIFIIQCKYKQYIGHKTSQMTIPWSLKMSWIMRSHLL